MKLTKYGKLMFLDFPRNFFGERHINELPFPPKNQPWCKISAICLVFIFEINIKLFYKKNNLKPKIVVFSVAFNVIRGWYFVIQKKSPGTFLSEARLIMTSFFIQRHLGHTFWLFALLENFFDQILYVFYCEGPIDTNVIFMRAVFNPEYLVEQISWHEAEVFAVVTPLDLKFNEKRSHHY